MTIPITRHVKIRGVANPYDPDWECYFEQRLDQQMVNTLQGKGKLLRLWQQQQGRCPVCQEKITAQTGWHSHHLIYKVQGGADTLNNRVLLHPNCHTSPLPGIESRQTASFTGRWKGLSRMR